MSRTVNVTFSYHGWRGWCPVIIGKASDAPGEVAYKARWGILAPWLDVCTMALDFLGWLYETVTLNDAKDSIRVTGKMNPIITYTYVEDEDESEEAAQ